MTDHDKIEWPNIPIGGEPVARILLRTPKRRWWDWIGDLLCRVGLHRWRPWDDGCAYCEGIFYCARCGEHNESEVGP